MAASHYMAARKKCTALFCVVLFAATFYFYSLYNYNLSYSDTFEELCVDSRKAGKSPISSSETGSTLVLVLVLSRPNSMERRNAIRNTWMKRYGQKQQGVLVKFSIGTNSLSKTTLDDIVHEQDTFGDLLLIHNVVESYSNLTWKVLETFVESNKHYKFSYVLKCDDDTFLALDMIVEELRQRTSKKSYYWGKMFKQSRVRTTGKFAEKEWFLCDSYPPYALGAAYIISGDLVRIIALNYHKLVKYHNEDVSVSVWISPYDVERRHDERVCEVKPFTYYSCRKTAIVLHPVSANDIMLLQKAYDRNRKKC